MAIIEETVSQGFRWSETHEDARGLSVIAVEPLRIGAALDSFFGVNTVETVGWGDLMLANEIGQVTLTDLMRVVDQLSAASQLTLVEGLRLFDNQAVQRAFTIIERLGLSDLIASSAIYNLTRTEGLRLLESLVPFFGINATEDVQLSDALLNQTRAIAALTESLQLSRSVTPVLLLNVVATESVRITPEMAITMLFQPTVTEGIELVAGFLQPNGTFTTWAMNVRTGAVTEYGNFVFNSFARIGNKYYGASDTGIYELLGDTDAGAAIIARIKSGFLQFGGTQLSRLKQAYIAARGEGGFVLKITTGDGLSYTYSIDTRNMRSTRVHMGKGQRARYFAFELISEGQDFDLDTLEFVPIVVERRV